MSRALTTLLTATAAAVLLSACTVTFVPGDVGVDVRASVGASLGTRVADGWPATVPPGLQVADRDVRRDRLRYDLAGGASVGSVYDRLHTDLVAAGWRRTELRVRPTRVDADYRQDGWELEVTVAHRGNDRVRVTLELDD